MGDETKDDADGIQVNVRIRPLSSSVSDPPSAWKFSSTSLLREDQAHGNKVFDFDHVLGPSTTNAQLHETVSVPLVTRFLQGFNATVFAFGQTGSGKQVRAHIYMYTSCSQPCLATMRPARPNTPHRTGRTP